jgi:hypothetical protein
MLGAYDHVQYVHHATGTCILCQPSNCPLLSPAAFLIICILNNTNPSQCNSNSSTIEKHHSKAEYKLLGSQEVLTLYHNISAVSTILNPHVEWLTHKYNLEHQAK